MSLPRFKTQFVEAARPYTGPELRPHFLLSELKIEGSALAAFRGPCLVETGHLVDWEDRLASDRIEAKEMVHFLGEFFGLTLREGVFLQRLLMSIMADVVREHGRSHGVDVRRDGDDLFVDLGQGPPRKLSVSIVTASPVSLLLHAGINIDPAGAPVPAIGLAELGIEPKAWIQEVLARFQKEWDGMDWACVKVRPVM